MKIRAILGALILLLLSAPAYSAFIELDLVSGSGDKFKTLDTQTDLLWLDVPLTVGMSAADAVSAYNGFRLATKSEVETLYINAGLDLSIFTDYCGCNRSTDNYEGARLLLDLLGENPNHPRGWSFHQNRHELDPQDADLVGLSSIVIFDRNFLTEDPFNFPTTTPYMTDIQFASDPTPRSRYAVDNELYGSYLVASVPSVSPVPIPAAALLFGTGILGLIGFSKRRKAA